MATIVRTPSGTWKAVIRKTGWPTAPKTFRIKRDAEDWSRRTEDDMVRGAYVRNAAAERMTVASALERYLREVTPTKKPSTQQSERRRAVWLAAELGRYSLTALTPEVIAVTATGALPAPTARSILAATTPCAWNWRCLAICSR